MGTDQHVRRRRRLHLRGLPKERAADKAGMDTKTAGKYRRLGKLPSEVRRMERHERTRPDPFAEVWPQLEEQLRLNPGWQAKTLFDDLQRRWPGRFVDGQLRTLPRHIKRWRALFGTIHVQGNTYSVTSRLIGERVEARLYRERVEVRRRGGVDAVVGER